MNTDWRFIPGPWFFEPERIEWRTPNGTPCLIIRNNLGGLCGYAGVPPSHPLYGNDGDNLDCHGGITYACKCSGSICHVPREGEDHDIWWFGFDCGHAGDLMPFELPLREHLGFSEHPNIYRDASYVKAETENLARQLEEQANVQKR